MKFTLTHALLLAQLALINPELAYSQGPAPAPSPAAKITFATKARTKVQNIWKFIVDKVTRDPVIDVETYVTAKDKYKAADLKKLVEEKELPASTEEKIAFLETLFESKGITDVDLKTFIEEEKRNIQKKLVKRVDALDFSRGVTQIQLEEFAADTYLLVNGSPYQLVDYFKLSHGERVKNVVSEYVKIKFIQNELMGAYQDVGLNVSKVTRIEKIKLFLAAKPQKWIMSGLMNLGIMFTYFPVQVPKIDLIAIPTEEAIKGTAIQVAKFGVRAEVQMAYEIIRRYTFKLAMISMISINGYLGYQRIQAMNELAANRVDLGVGYYADQVRVETAKLNKDANIGNQLLNDWVEQYRAEFGVDPAPNNPEYLEMKKIFSEPSDTVLYASDSCAVGLHP